MSNSDDSVVHGRRQGRVANLWRRALLTYRYRGPRATAWRALTFPLRATPLGARLALEGRLDAERRRARLWYRREGRPVTIVIPSYRDVEHVTRLVRSIRRTTRRDLVQIVVADDASGREHVDAVQELADVELVVGDENRGFAPNVNRGLEMAARGNDVVLLNSDMTASKDWLACLQYAAYDEARVGVVGAKLLYPDGRVQSAGSIRHPKAPEWFDHRYRFKPPSFGPANVAGPMLALTGACMYIRREALEDVGALDAELPMAYEDVDFCLRAWQAGHRVFYAPSSVLTHVESATRGTDIGERERRSQARFWQKWGSFFDERRVRTSEGRLRIAFVTETTAIGGGHRVVFEHANRLSAAGHDVSIYSLGGRPDWFDLGVPLHSFASYAELIEALTGLEALKVATWWKTAIPVWEASVVDGVPVYFVQDIETSYYPDDPRARARVLASYRPEFSYLTVSSWNREQLEQLGIDAEVVPNGVDTETFRPLPDVARRTNLLLGVGRSNHLKNLRLTVDAWRALPDPRPELRLFGVEPELANRPGMHYVEAPADAEVNVLLNEASAFVQTSQHEGFCLPVLEAMAAGTPVVCTDAHGNRDFCRDGSNCLIVPADRRAVRNAIARVLNDAGLRERLRIGGLQTAADYGWPRATSELEAALERIAATRAPTGSPRRAAPRA